MGKDINKVKVYGSAVLFSLIIGFSFLGIKTSVQVATPLEILTYRFNFAFIAALIPVIFGFVKVHLANKSRRNLAITVGFYVGFMVLQTIGLQFASSIESGIIFAIIPIITKILAWFILGEKGGWKQNVFIGVSVLSVVIMFVLSVQDFEGLNFVGLIILFLSSVSISLSNVYMRYVRNEYKPYAISFAITCCGCLLFNIATLALGLANGTVGDYFAPMAHPEFVIATAFLGIPSTLISSILLTYMLANLEAVKATVFGNLSTAISIFVGAIVLKEILLAYHIICAALIIVGVIGTSVVSNQKFVEGGNINVESKSDSRE